MTPRDRRALAAGAVTIALALLLLRGAPWAWRGVQGVRDGAEARAELLARMRADIRSADELEDSATVIRRRMASLAPAFLTGGTAGEAAADLGSRLSAAAERHRVRVSRTDHVADSSRTERLGRVTLRLALESDTRGLLGLLDAAAKESAVLVVDELRIAVVEPHVPADRPEVLQSELTVRGWYLPREGAR